MAVAVVVAIGFLLMLWLVLSTVRRLRPGTFRFKATLTRWVSLDLEMHSPEGVQSPANQECGQAGLTEASHSPIAQGSPPDSQARA